jgi:hypothetical protein
MTPVTAAAAIAPEPLAAVPIGVVDAPWLHAIAEGGADTKAVLAEPGAQTEGTPEASSVVAAVPTQSPNAAVDDSRSVWSTAADGGTAIGRKSKEAGVATAGFFTRFARRVASSF